MSANEQDPTLIRTLKGHKQSVITLDLYPSCKYIASAGMDNTIFLWNLTKKTAPLKLIGHKSQIHDIKFSPTGNILASASNDESLKFWDIDYENTKKETTLIKAHNARIRGLSFSCDGLLLASCGDDQLIKVWSSADRRLQYTLKKHTNWVRYCQFSPTAMNLASCDDKFVHIWDVNTKKHIQSYKEHSGVIHAVKFHSLGNCMASCSHDTKIKLYDLRSQNVIQIYEGHSGPVKSIDFHPTSPYLISSSDDGTTKIWNSKAGRLQYTLQCHSNATKFSRHGDYFVTGGSEKVIQVWKSGFFDSLNERILPNESNSSKQNRKVHSETKDVFETQVSIHKIPPPVQQNNKKMATARELLKEYQRKQGGKQVIYDHQQNNFQLLDDSQFIQTTKLTKKSIAAPSRTKNRISLETRNQKTLNLVTSQNNEQSQEEQQQIKLPDKILKKMHKISSQLQFITKTTQILEARVLNNGEQLNRLISLYSGSSNGVNLQFQQNKNKDNLALFVKDVEVEEQKLKVKI